MVNFVLSDQLKKLFTVFGGFYDLEISNSMALPCRNVLEIYKKDFFISNGFQSNADALFIMMNPGSSEPKDRDYNSHSI